MKTYFLKILILLYFVVSLFFVARFSLNADIYNIFNLSWQPLFLKIFIFLFSIAFVQSLSYFKKINQFLSLTLLLILLAILTGNTWPILLVLLIVLASLAAGKYFHDLFNIGNKNLPDIFLLGIGLLGTIVGLIAFTKYNYPGIYGLLLMIPILCQRKYLISLTLGLNFLIKEKYKFNLTNLIIQCLLVIFFLYSLMPETGHDALATHLFIPSNVSLQHQWGFDPELYVFAVTPMLGDWIYTLSYMLAGEVSSKLITFLFICILAYYVKRLAQWASFSKKNENLSSLLFLSTPLVFLESSSAYIDSIWTAFVIASFLSFSRFFFLKKASLSSTKSFAIYNALALQTKAISFTSQLGLLPLIFLNIFVNKSFQKIAKFFIYALAAALILGFIPYYIAYLKSGNPVFPLFNNIFKSIYFPFVAFENPLYPSGLRWDFLYQATFHTKYFLESNDGGIGYVYFLFLIPSLLTALINKNYKIIFLASIAFFSLALTFMGTSYLRYIFPFFVIASAIIGASYNMRSNNKFSKIMLSSILIYTLILNLIYFKAAVNYSNSLNLKPMLSSEDKRIFLRRVMPIKDAFDIVNVLNINANPVLIFGNETATGINADAIYVSWYNPKIVEMLTNAKNVKNTLDSLIYFHVKYIIIDYSILPQVADPIKIRGLLEDASEEILRINNVTIRKIKS